MKSEYFSLILVKKDYIMNKKFIALASLGILTLHNAYALNPPGSATVTLAASYYQFDNDRDLQNKILPNASLSYNFTDHWAIEGSMTVINTKHDNDNDDDDDDDADENVHGFLYTIDGIY